MKKQWLLLPLILCSAAAAKPRPNVVFFALDDLSDWINPMGYEQAITPNMDRLAAAGVTYQNAQTAGIYCAPSRSAIFTGRHPSTTGCYTDQVYYHNHPDIVPLQMAFKNAGYSTFGAGKLFHHARGFIDPRGWDQFFIRDDELKKRGWPLETWKEFHYDMLPNPYPASVYNKGLGRPPTNGFFLEWGPIPNHKEERMADTMRTNWACDILKKKHDKPFFLGVGLYSPHFPNYAPQKYFDMYDRSKIKAPPYMDGDIDDIPPIPRKEMEKRSAFQARLEKLGAVEDAVMGYLACVTYADAMLGRVLDAITEGPNARNTIVVLWSDHGYHHGEKEDWGKRTLWERTTNVPLIFAGPGIARGQSIEASASLLDMYPTLMELCRIPVDKKLEGVSLADDLKNPHKAVDRFVYVSGTHPNEFAVMNRTWRYIRYRDGTEELYHVEVDPNEWHNLADKPEYEPMKKKLAGHAPKSFAKPGPSSHALELMCEGDDYWWENKKGR